MKKLLVMLRSVLVFSIVLSAECFAQVTGGGSNVDGGNPAAYNCLKLRGSLEKVVTELGEDANCVIEKWHLFSEMSKRGLTKDVVVTRNKKGGVSIPNPASVNCLNISGELRIQTNSQGQFGLCVVAQWDLFKIINVLEN